MFRVRLIRYLVVTLSFTYGGVDYLHSATALHGDADVGWMTAEVAALPRPRQRQHCCYDNQLHPLLGAAQIPATRGDQVSHQILHSPQVMFHFCASLYLHLLQSQGENKTPPHGVVVAVCMCCVIKYNLDQ